MAWGIVGAIEGEMQPIIDNMGRTRESRSNSRSSSFRPAPAIFQGSVGEHSVVVMTTGVGKARTAASIQYLLDHYPIQAVIFAGVAGALNPELKVGDIVIGQKAVQHDYDAGGRGVLEEMKTPWFEADPELVDLAVRAGQELGLGERVRTGTILTGDQTIVDSRKRQWLHRTFGGDCVEMEGAAVALVCSLNGVPFVLIRAISDLADENARRDFRQNMSQAAMNSARIVLAMLGQGNEVRLLKRNSIFRVRRFLARQAWALESKIRSL